METIFVSVIEDNPAYRRTLEDMLELSSGIECFSVYEAAEKALDDEALHEKQPAILLLDLNLSGMSGFNAIPLLRKRLPKTEIIVLTNNDDHRAVLEGIQLGISGYMVKGGAIQDIRRVIREVSEGGVVIDPKLSKYVLRALSGDSNKPKEEGPLSPREKEVLELLAQGFAKKEIADQLGLSYHAIALYTRNIYKKLGTPNIAAAVAKAIREQII